MFYGAKQSAKPKLNQLNKWREAKRQMAGLTATASAERLGVTKSRISQLVSSGKLEGC